MGADAYNAWTTVLGIGVLVALGLAAVYFFAAVIGWRGSYRNYRLGRFALFLFAASACVAIQQSLLWFVFLPTVRHENRQRIKESGETGSMVHVHDSAPAFTLTTIDGREFALAELQGKVVLVNFFATWCGPCLMELPHVQRIWDKHHDNGRFALIVVGREETAEKISEFQSKHGYTFPMAPDPDRSVYSLYAREKIPRTYLIGPDGKICFQSIGFNEADLATLQAEIAKQLETSR